MIETPPVSADRGFEILCQSLQSAERKKKGSQAELQRRIAAHIRAVTGQGTGLLAQYHNDKSVSDDDKIALYKLCVRAIHFGDYTILSGQVGSGDKRIEPETTTTTATPERKKTVQPTTTEPPSTTTTAMSEDRSITPAPEAVKRSVEEPQDELTRILLKRIEPYLPQGGAVDEERVKAIIADYAITNPATDEEAVKAIVTKCLNNGEFPANRVKEIAEQVMQEQGIVRVVIQQPDGSVNEVGRQHYKFPLLVASLGQRLNVLLVGPAGSFKTTAAHSAAKALSLSFEAVSIGPMTSKADLFGFKDAGGTYHDTGLVRQFAKGGAFLADELDAGNAGVMTQINMGLANGHVSTPNGMVEKHKDFVFIGAANTYGMGANRVYVGRNQLDAATLDRFVVIDWDYDEGMEASLVGVRKASPKLQLDDGGKVEPKDWIAYVHKLREAVDRLAIRQVFSPRATLHGCKLFDAGVGRKHVEEMVLWKGLDSATRQKIEGACQ